MGGAEPVIAHLRPGLILATLLATASGGAIGIATPAAVRHIVDTLAPSGASGAIALVTIGLIVAAGLSAALAYGAGLANQRLWLTWERYAMSGALARLIVAAPVRDMPPAASLERLRGAAQAREAFAAAGLTLAGAGTVLIASGGYLIWLAPLLGTLALAGLALLSLTVALLLRTQTAARIEAAEAESDATGLLSAALRVRLDGGGVPGEMEGVWQRAHARRMTAAVRAQAWRDGQRAIDAIAAPVAPAALLGTAWLVSPELGAADLAAVFAAFGQCLMGAFALSWASANLAQAGEGVRMLHSLPRDFPAVGHVQSSADTGPVLAFSAVRFGYPGAPPILSDLSFTLDPGETLAVTGPSGVGKSTLVRLAAGLLPPDAGEIRLAGTDPAKLDPEARRRLFGVITSEIPDFGGTLAEEAGLDTAWAEAVTNRRIHQIALSRAFAGTPRLILLDEALSAEDAALIDAIFHRADESGAAILMVTHDPALAARCNRQLTLGT